MREVTFILSSKKLPKWVVSDSLKNYILEYYSNFINFLGL